MKKIFSGKDSIPLWDAINVAKTIQELRDALYLIGCKLQELEHKLDVKYPGEKECRKITK